MMMFYRAKKKSSPYVLKGYPKWWLYPIESTQPMDSTKTLNILRP